MIPRMPNGSIDWLILEGDLIIAMMLVWIVYCVGGAFGGKP